MFAARLPHRSNLTPEPVFSDPGAADLALSKAKDAGLVINV
jgi:hypothetical protein